MYAYYYNGHYQDSNKHKDYIFRKFVYDVEHMQENRGAWYAVVSFDLDNVPYCISKSTIQEMDESRWTLITGEKKVRYLKQCCTCEKPFYYLAKDDTCPHCGSGNWVYGWIDEPENFLTELDLQDLD